MRAGVGAWSTPCLADGWRSKCRKANENMMHGSRVHRCELYVARSSHITGRSVIKVIILCPQLPQSGGVKGEAGLRSRSNAIPPGQTYDNCHI